MKKRFAISLIIAAFVAGAFASHFGLRSEIEKTNKFTQSMIDNVSELAASQENIRAIDSLESTIEAISYILDLEKRGAPRKYIGEEYIATLKKRISALEAKQAELNTSTETKRSKVLLTKGKKLIEEIEFNYL